MSDKRPRNKHAFKFKSVVGKKRRAEVPDPEAAEDSKGKLDAYVEEQRELKRAMNEEIEDYLNEEVNAQEESKKIDLQTFYAENKQTFDGLNQEDLQLKLNKSFKFSFGNFDHLYNPKDNSCSSDIEDRLSVLPAEWFRDKKVLDVGCNDGTFTLALTLNYSPNLIIGVDIDNKLVSRAIKNIHLITNDLIAKSLVDEVSQAEAQQENAGDGDAQMPDEKEERMNLIKSQIESLPRSLRLSLSLPSIVKAMGTNAAFKNKVSKDAKEFLYERLCFRTENFIANIEPVFEKYDVIM